MNFVRVGGLPCSHWMKSLERAGPFVGHGSSKRNFATWWLCIQTPGVFVDRKRDRAGLP